MLFSIVVPVYKAENYLEQCVNSILNQSFTDFELILVDDGSPDKCPELCDFFSRKDHRVKVIHQGNGGVVKARTVGVNNAQGKYILNVDSDDYIDVDLLYNLQHVINKYDCDIVAFNATVVSNSKSYTLGNSLKCGYYQETMPIVKLGFMYDKNQHALNFGNILFSLCTKVIKRERLKKYQQLVPELICKGDDLAVVAPLIYESQSIVVIDESGYFYRVNDRSIMHSYSERDLESLKALTEYLKKYCDNTYLNNLYMCTAKMYLEHIVNLINTSNNYYDFRKKNESAYKAYGNEYISFCNTKNLRVRDKIILVCLKNRKSFILYIAYKFKGIIDALY